MSARGKQRGRESFLYEPLGRPRAERGLHFAPLAQPMHPALFAKRLAPLHTEAQAFEFRPRVCAIHPRDPAPWPVHWPVTEPGPQLREK